MSTIPPGAGEVAGELDEFLRAQFPATTGDLRRDVDLFESGIVDSVGVAETLAHIEERYGVEVPDDVLLSDEFTTVDGMARCIVELCAGAIAQP
jgi:acyl carrier protein